MDENVKVQISRLHWGCFGSVLGLKSVQVEDADILASNFTRDAVRQYCHKCKQLCK